VPQDLHGAARLVAAIRDLQPPLPATSLGVVAPIRQYLGTIDSGRRRCIAVTRSIDGATLGRALAARRHSAAAKLWQAVGWSAATLPTILAWDWTAIRRILPIEARSP